MPKRSNIYCKPAYFNCIFITEKTNFMQFLAPKTTINAFVLSTKESAFLSLNQLVPAAVFKIALILLSVLYLQTNVVYGSPQTLTVDCPVNITVTEGMKTDTSTLGSPRVKQNTGGAVTIGYFEIYDKGTCSRKYDLLTRVFTVTNTSGEQVRCNQYIQINHISANQITVTADTFMQFPTSGGSFTLNLLRLAREFASVTISYKDSIISAGNCINPVRMLRRWTFVDKCNGSTKTASTFITVPNYSNSFSHNNTFTDAVCADEGYISISAKSGFPPYQYKWSNGALGSSISNLPAALYLVTVTDANQCTTLFSYDVKAMSERADIGGRITTLNGYRVYPDSVKFGDLSNINLFCISYNGGLQYGFTLKNKTPGFYNYSFVKKSDVINGITTKDIIIIQKHLLGQKEFADTLQYFAADVNNNYNVTASDIVEIRKLILGIKATFSNVPPWYFIRKDWMEVITPYNSLNSITFKGMQINSFPRQNADLFGLKLGDLDYSYRDIGYTKSTSRSTTSYISIKNQAVLANKKITVPVQINSSQSIEGLQFKLKLDPSLDQIQVKVPDHLQSYVFYNEDHGTITFSYSTGVTMSAQEIKNLNFTIEAQTTENALLSQLIKLDNSVEPEVYDEQLDAQSIEINWNSDQILSNANANEFVILPQPVSNGFAIRSTHSLQRNISVSIFDLQGKLIYQDSNYTEGTFISSSNWTKSFYQLIISDQEKTSVLKFIVQ